MALLSWLVPHFLALWSDILMAYLQLASGLLSYHHSLLIRFANIVISKLCKCSEGLFAWMSNVRKMPSLVPLSHGSQMTLFFNNLSWILFPSEGKGRDRHDDDDDHKLSLIRPIEGTNVIKVTSVTIIGHKCNNGHKCNKNWSQM